MHFTNILQRAPPLSRTRQLKQLSGQGGPASLGEQLCNQQQQVKGLQSTLQKIATLAQEATKPPNALSAGSQEQDQPSSDERHPQNSIVHTENRNPMSEGGPFPIPGLSMPVIPLCNDEVWGTDLRCGESERNFLQVLGHAFSIVEGFPLTLGILANDPVADDDFCIRAVMQGWGAAGKRAPADPAWTLLQAVDQGLFYRADPVTRLTLLRLMRSMILQRMDPSSQRRSVPEYMRKSQLQSTVPHAYFLDFFPWPEFRDYWIARGLDYASEMCASSFARSIYFKWPFEFRDAFMRDVFSDTFSFSHEFNTRYSEIGSWHLVIPAEHVQHAQALPF
ncbi:hypothetical protein BDV25DRAFT_143539 [Aspergillus avenaceus]|uniref:Uncharacterized protein n=1 Tax=Aspergillus avenaceus TaxID=36643 RepID=A0A5N6TJV0_ASPAV|nr:hypothetical protein BDV25DRAFT_143539 [Aspergillus avenaceus]